MQPNPNSTGYNPQPQGNPGMFQVPQHPTVPILPAPTGLVPPVPLAQSAAQAALPVSTPQPSATPEPASADQWMTELQQVLVSDQQSPRRRAIAIAELKARYQQQVLGIKGRKAV